MLKFIFLRFFASFLFSFRLLFVFELFFRFPFNWKSPFGYFVAVSIQVASIFTILRCCYFLVCFFIGFCWMMISFGEDIETEVHLLKSGKDGSNNIWNKFIDIVEFHSKTKQLSEIFGLGATRT